MALPLPGINEMCVVVGGREGGGKTPVTLLTIGAACRALHAAHSRSVHANGCTLTTHMCTQANMYTHAHTTLDLCRWVMLLGAHDVLCICLRA